jgi:catechol-2,3-dioxygenase
MRINRGITTALLCGGVIAGCRAGARVGPAHAGGAIDPNYEVTAIGPSLDFYTSDLGFKLEQRTDRSATLTRENVILNLKAPEFGSPNTRLAMKDPLVIQVDDLTATVQRLRDENVQIESGIDRTGRDHPTVTIDDPDGNPVKLVQRQ